jgi:hypothetical protein
MTFIGDIISLWLDPRIESAFSKRCHILSLNLTEGVKMLTQEYLKSILSYNHETGMFLWKERKKGRRMNKTSGHLNKSYGYIEIFIDGKSYYAHLLAWMYEYGYFSVKQIDHINNIRNDNRIINLREATQSQNSQNLKKAISSNKSTGLLGAYRVKGTNRFTSKIKINDKTFNLGRFNTKEEAHKAYLDKKREIHPFNTL